jgi:hypothetical protein
MHDALPARRTIATTRRRAIAATSGSLSGRQNFSISSDKTGNIAVS